MESMALLQKGMTLTLFLGSNMAENMVEQIPQWFHATARYLHSRKCHTTFLGSRVQIWVRDYTQVPKLKCLLTLILNWL